MTHDRKAHGNNSEYPYNGSSLGYSSGQTMQRDYSQNSSSSGSSYNIYDNSVSVQPSDMSGWSPPTDNWEESYAYYQGTVPTYIDVEGDEQAASWGYDNTGTDAGGYFTHDDYTTTADATPYASIPAGHEVPRSAIARHGSSDGHVCLTPGCDARPFRRKADLERHYKHKHRPDDEKEQYYCDYTKCGSGRNQDAFHRMDHCRDHYRDYHMEDLNRKNGEKSSWWQERKFSRNSWRCTKCLRKNRVSEGWDCMTPNCSYKCETQRRSLRGYA